MLTCFFFCIFDCFERSHESSHVTIALMCAHCVFRDIWSISGWKIIYVFCCNLILSINFCNSWVLKSYYIFYFSHWIKMNENEVLINLKKLLNYKVECSGLINRIWCSWSRSVPDFAGNRMGFKGVPNIWHLYHLFSLIQTEPQLHISWLVHCSPWECLMGGPREARVVQRLKPKSFNRGNIDF